MRKALRTNSRGVLPNLARAIVAIIVRLPVRERPSYKHIAEVLARATGCFVTEDHIKTIRIKREEIAPQCVSQLSATDIEFARLYGTNPIAIEQMRGAIIPGSIAESQFAEIWGRRLPAPVLMVVNDRCDDATEFAHAIEHPVALVAVAGGCGGARLDERPSQMAKSSKPVKPALLAERAAFARIERVIEPTQPDQINLAQDQSFPELTNLDQARVDKWIRDRLVADWRDSCWHCRQRVIAGQNFIDVRGNDVVVRFHTECETDWRKAQEALARRAMGLDRSERP